MIEFITSNFYPDYHPVASLGEKHRVQYVRGLGELLSLFLPDNSKAKFAFSIICSKLSSLSVDDVWHHNVKIDIKGNVSKYNKYSFYNYMNNGVYTEHYVNNIIGLIEFKRANRLKREGFRFFRMCSSFWCDFYRICRLAGYPVYKRNIADVLDKITQKRSRKYSINVRNWMFADGYGELVPQTFKNALDLEKSFKQKAPLSILVVGTMSAGKSTLINALAGNKISKVKTTVCTCSISRYCNTPNNNLVIYKDGNIIKVLDHANNDMCDFTVMMSRFYGELCNTPLILIDTPGVNYAYDKTHREMTLKEIESGNYDAMICVINSAYMESDESKNLVDNIAKAGHKNVVFVLNQFDKFMPEDDSIDECIQTFKAILRTSNIKADVIPFSARAALLFKKFSKGETLSDIENAELQEYKKKICNAYYDMGAYITGKPSEENDYDAKTGLKYLESYILKQ